MNNPCHNCQFRSVLCHHDCVDYTAYVEWMKDTNERIRASKQIYDYQHDILASMSVKRKKQIQKGRLGWR